MIDSSALGTGGFLDVRRFQSGDSSEPRMLTDDSQVYNMRI